MAPPLRPSDVHTDAILTNFVVAYPFNQYVAHRLFPVVPVKKESDKFYKFYQGDKIVRHTKRADGALSGRADFGLTSDTYSCEEWALHTDIGQRTIDNADSPLRPLEDAAANLKEMVMLDREIQAQALAQASTNPKASPGAQWNTSSAAIEDDFVDAKAAVRIKIGRDPNVVVMNDQVADAILKYLIGTKTGSQVAYPSIDAYLKFNQLPPSLWGCDVLVGTALKSSQVRDDQVAAANISRVWNDNVLFAYVAPRPGIRTISYGYTFRVGGEQVRRWGYQDARKAQGVEYSVVEDYKVVSTDACYMLEDVLS